VAGLATFASATNRTEPLDQVEAEDRDHAAVELAIPVLKDQALAHFRSGRFTANAAWTVIGCIAHNLLRWMTLIGLPNHTVPSSRTIRRRRLSLPGRLTTSGGQWTLHRFTCHPAGDGNTTSSRTRAHPHTPHRLTPHATHRSSRPATPRRSPDRQRRVLRGSARPHDGPPTNASPRDASPRIPDSRVRRIRFRKPAMK
jgi:hypothetical protein